MSTMQYLNYLAGKCSGHLFYHWVEILSGKMDQSPGKFAVKHLHSFSLGSFPDCSCFCSILGRWGSQIQAWNNHSRYFSLYSVHSSSKDSSLFGHLWILPLCMMQEKWRRWKTRLWLSTASCCRTRSLVTACRTTSSYRRMRLSWGAPDSNFLVRRSEQRTRKETRWWDTP